MGRVGRMIRRGAAACACAAAAAPAAAPAAPGQSAPYVDWPALLPPLGAPHTPSTVPDCPDGAASCIDRTILEMQRRFHAVVPRCDHRAVFALAYLRVTEDVRDAVNDGLYRDRVWLQQLDAVFARLYFEAYDRYERGERDGVPVSWRIAFDAQRDRTVSALGDFLLSMNAHINRDFPFVLAALGITTPEGVSRKPEHDVYNRRLAALYAPVLAEVAARFDPTADDAELGPVDDELAYAILQSWREGVWRNAERLVLARSEAARAQVAREIELYAQGIGLAIRAALPADPAARDAWCARHGGQDPALAPRVDGAAAPAPARRRAGAARLALPRRGLRRSASGTVRIPLRCPAGGAACRGSVTLHRPAGGPLLARARYAVPAGRTRAVAVRLGRTARRLVAADRGRVRLTLRRSGVRARSSVTRRTVRLR